MIRLLALLGALALASTAVVGWARPVEPPPALGQPLVVVPTSGAPLAALVTSVRTDVDTSGQTVDVTLFPPGGDTGALAAVGPCGAVRPCWVPVGTAIPPALPALPDLPLGTAEPAPTRAVPPTAVPTATIVYLPSPTVVIADTPTPEGVP